VVGLSAFPPPPQAVGGKQDDEAQAADQGVPVLAAAGAHALHQVLPGVRRGAAKVVSVSGLIIRLSEACYGRSLDSSLSVGSSRRLTLSLQQASEHPGIDPARGHKVPDSNGGGC
jgi:hypothetical protein